MKRRFDEYAHINETSKFTVELDIEEVAAKIVGMNYGCHRLLCAMVRAIRRRDNGNGYSASAEKLQEFIDGGWF
jgi:hypothetical protein